MAILKDQYCLDKEILEAGIDEAGAGCFAGPLVSACVILPNEIEGDPKMISKIKDSKKFSSHKIRKQVSEFIKEIAIDWNICWIQPEEIDKINIRNARLKSFQEASKGLIVTPDLLLIDGDMYKPYVNKDGISIDYVTVIGGDAEYKSIAAASIIAKVERDEYMMKIHKEFPEYNWEKNKGYGTKEHRDIISDLGITKYHRRSFGICKSF